VTYWALNAVFLAAAGVLVLAAVLARRAPRWSAIGFAAIVLIVMTAVFDNVIIGVGLVDYDPARISGIRLGVAPIEDFAYAVAAVLALPSIWHLLPARAVRSGRSDAAASTRAHRSRRDGPSTGGAG
jgi:lycopene cyclase domain-containing protein